MSRHRTGRTQACGAAEALAKLSRAKRFLEAADLVKDEPDPDFMSVAAALAVLAGIAASDAACCKALGLRSRGRNRVWAAPDPTTFKASHNRLSIPIESAPLGRGFYPVVRVQPTFTRIAPMSISWWTLFDRSPA